MKAVYVFLLLILSILLGSPSQSNASTIYHKFPFDLTYQEVLNLLPPGDRVAYENEVDNFYIGLLKPYLWYIAGVSRDPFSPDGLRVSGYASEDPTEDPAPVVKTHQIFWGFISENWPSDAGWFIYSDPPPPPPVPIPGAIYLLGSGFIILIGIRKKYKG